jgi:hypothetical protein
MADTTDPKTRGLLMQLIFGFFPSAVIYVAARLKIPDLLAAGPKRSEELAGLTGTHAPSLYRLLRALAYLGILEETGSGSFGLTDLGQPLRSDVPGSVWATSLLFGGEGVWRSWGELLSGVRSGEMVYRRIFGMEPFENQADDPEAAAMFNRAMSEGTRETAPAVIGVFDFTSFGTLVDVGGGDGTLLTAIVAATPGLRGVLFDTAAGVAQAPERLEAAGVADRCQIVEGDFFQAVPDGGDAYIMKSIIHDWDDDRCVTILGNCRRAMADGGKVLIVEPVLPPKVEPSFTVLGTIMSDINMLLVTGGKERTEAEFAEVLRSAGLQLTSVAPTPPPSVYSVIEAVGA